jgi:hypothetical protein
MMPLTKAFVAHLPTRKECRAVLSKFDRDFEGDVALVKANLSRVNTQITLNAPYAALLAVNGLLGRC